MSYRWQYPSYVEPLVTTRAAQADKWTPELPALVPRPKRSLTTAILAGVMFFVPIVSAPAETVTVDKYQRALSEPVRIAARPLGTGLTVIDPSALNRPIRAFLPVSEPIRRIPQPLHQPLSVIDPIALKLPEPAQIDKWGQPVGTPPRGRTPLVPVGLTVVHPLPLPTVTVPPLDSWEPHLVVPVPPRKPLLAVGVQIIDPTALTLPEPVKPDKWYVPLSEPVRKPRLRHSEQFAPVFVPASIPRLESWEARTYGPVPPRRQLPREGFTVIDPSALNLPEPTQLDKWYQPLALPRWDVRRQLWLYPAFAADQLYNIPTPSSMPDSVTGTLVPLLDVRSLAPHLDKRTLVPLLDIRTQEDA
jgi:hypothetical protein